MLCCGLASPAIGTVFGSLLFPAASTGSLVERDGVVVGSRLTSQPFADRRYLMPRPSAAGQDLRVAAGSNLVPTAAPPDWRPSPPTAPTWCCWTSACRIDGAEDLR